MDISNGRLGFTQDLDNQKFLNALRQSNRGVTDFNAHLQQNFNQSLISVNDLAKGVTAFLTIDYATQFASQIVKVRGEFEQLEIAFTTMLGSKEKADQLMQEIVTFAATTPFGLQSTSEATKMLLAYGESADTALDTMRKLGDIASGVGIPLKDIAYLYGTTMTQGRLYTQDLNQFLGRGIPMMDELAKVLGVAKNEVKGLVEDGKVGFPEVQKAIDNLTASGSMFGGLMEAQSKSVSGQIEQLKDAIDVMFNDIGKNSQGFITSVISSGSTIVENYEVIGRTLGVLITTYGAYKAALLTIGAIESARAKTVATEIANLSISEKMQLGRLAVTQRQAQATLANAEAELVNNQAILTSMQAEVSSLAIKKQKAVALAIERTQLAQTAQVQLALGQAELRSIQATGTAREIKIAQRNVEKAQNAVIATQEAAEVSRKSSLAASQTFYNAQQNLGNQSQRTKIAQTALSNAQDAVSVATKNLNTASTARLTLAQHAQALSAKAAATWQAFLNATMLANPIVAVTAVVGGLIAAYFLLRDTTTAAEKAQEAYNKTQEEVKSKLDETKQKAEEYISILKDETATVYQQIEAYKALQLLKLKGFENLSQEQIMTMDLIDLKKLLNLAMDDQGVLAQHQELLKLENERNKINKELYEREEAQKRNSYRTSEIKDSTTELKKQLEIIEINYNKQIEKINKIKQEQQLANLPLRDRAQYWENEIKKIEDAIAENENLNFGVKSTNPLIKDNTDAVNIFKVALQSVNISPLLTQLDEAKKQFSAINAEMGGAAIPEIKNKAYYDKYQKEAQFTLDNLDLNDPKNAEKIKALRTIIEGTTNALKKYNTVAQKTSTPKIGKPTKKADDPVEIYKKQVSEIEKQHERYLKILDSNDISFVTEKAILQAQLSSKGKTYEEYLRTQQKELSKTAETSEITRKKLSFVNDELLKLIDHSEVEIFKDNLDKQLDNADSIIEKLKIIDDVKNELSSNTNELTAPKIEFVDKTQLELIDQLDQKGKELVASLGGGYSQLQKLTNEYNNDILILTESLKNAKTEAEKTVINDAIWKRGVKFAEDSKDLPTNDDNYNKLLLDFKSFEQKKADIAIDFDNKIAVAKLNNDKKLEEQLLQEKKKALSKIALEQMKSSESFVKLLGDLDKMSVKSLDKLIKDIESQLDNPEIGLEMSAEDIKIILDQLQKAKDEIENKNPFKAIQEGWSDFWKATTDDDKLEALDKFMSGVNSAFEATKVIMDMTTDAVEAFGGKLDDSAKQTIQSVQNIVNGIGNAIQGYFSGDWAQMIAGIVQIVVEVAKIIGGSKDRKLEKRLKQQQEAVNDLKRAYDDLSFAIDRALGGRNYSLQEDQIKNLQEQKILMEQMIKNEEAKKKTDKNKVNEWKNAIADIDRQIQEVQENIASDILQTTAKELANTLGDALAEAFGKGEDAAKSFEKVANDVLKNAVLNQLKKRFIEDELQKALDKLQKDMGVDDKGWNGLTPEEQQEFRDKIKEIAGNFQGALEDYSDLFKDLVDPNENSLAGAIKGVSEETASLIAGQVNAMRLLIVEANKTRIDTNRILLQSLDRLANIDFNTKSANVILDKMYAFMQSNKDNNRSYGF